LLNLVGGILDAAKLEAGKFALQKTPTDIKKAVEQSVALFTTQAQTKHISLMLLSEDNLSQIALDPMRFGEVMNNLLSNALKFTPENGTVTVSIKKQQDDLQLTIKDTGIGIPKDRQSQLFSKFYQVHHDKKDLNYITKGTGLGLYIVKGIVEAHGGKVIVESQPGQGTAISFTLPYQSEEIASHSSQTAMLNTTVN
jgi:chemotaxis family two-component system sensor kinase Cph1